VLTERPVGVGPILSAPAVGLAWLILLRWVAVAGQVLILAGASLLLGAPATLGWIVALIGVAACTNAALLFWRPERDAAVRRLTTSLLLLDSLLLTGLLHLSGGAMNPFSVFYLVHVVLAALLLDTRRALVLAIVTSLGFASLFLWGSALDHHHHGGDGMSLLVHLQGMWLSYTLAAAFVGVAVGKVARALALREGEVAQLQRVRARSERLASISSLAAGAAHELGSPLATIAVVAEELERQAGRGDEGQGPGWDAVRGDARLLHREVERCRAIVAQMGGGGEGDAPRKISGELLLDELREELGDQRERVDVVGEPTFFVFAPPAELARALANLVRNGLDASPPTGRVALSLSRGAGEVRFEGRDGGSGIPAELLPRLGQPFLTTKDPGKGLGLGVFLAIRLAERLGGRLEVESGEGVGTSFLLTLPEARA
jgi:two-component system sensor histidine kinase RegB